MSLDRDLKRSLGARAGDVTASPDAFEQIALAARASQRRRAVMGGVMTVVLLAAGVGVATQLQREQTREPVPFATEPTEEASPSPSPVASWGRAYRDDDEGWQLRYPEGWRSGRFEAETEFHPEDLPGLQLGEPTFSVSIQLWPERYNEPTDLEAERRWTNVTVEGREAIRSGDDDVTVYRIDWTDAGCAPRTTCSMIEGPRTLRFAIHASTDELRQEHTADAELILEHLATLDEAPTGDVRTRRGTVDESAYEATGWDAPLTTLVLFMEARMSGGGAEDFLSASGKRAYADGDPNLYGEQGWAGYILRSRTDMTFTLDVTVPSSCAPDAGEGCDDAREGVLEEVEVGGTGDRFVIDARAA